MRSILLAATAVLATSVAASAQIGFEIDLEPGTTPEQGLWWDPGSGTPMPSHSTVDVRFRVYAPEGTWVRPLIDFQLDTTDPAGQAVLAAHPWLAVPTSESLTSLTQDLAPLYGLTAAAQVPISNGSVSVNRPDAFMRWTAFATTNGLSTPGPTGGRQWFQPMLSPSTTGATPMRLWTTDPVGWTVGNGPLNQQIWQGMQRNDNSAPDQFVLYACFKSSLLEHSVFTTGSTAAAELLLASDEWNSILNNNLFKLAIQVVGLRPPVVGNMPTDASVPDLFSPDIPLTMVSPGHTFAVSRPIPNGNSLFWATNFGNVVPNGALFFDSAEARNPVEVSFPVQVNGTIVNKVIQAFPDPTWSRPTRYKVKAPANAVGGTPQIRDGITQWQNIGPIQVQ